MPHVLVVDDIASDRLLVGGLFEEHPGWDVSYANNGKNALEAIQSNQPDVVVTDLMMPEMNGLELVRAITREKPQVPVVLMTSNGSEEIAVEALEAGAASYVPKRTVAHELQRVVHRVIRTSNVAQSRLKLMDRTRRVESIELENDITLVCSLACHLSETLFNFGICDHKGRLCAGTALDEALSNAYYHGNLQLDSQLREFDDMRYHKLADQRSKEPPYRDRRIYVKAKFTGTEATITVRDEGSGFDPSQLPDPTDPENMAKAHGRGVVLMRTFMDEVIFNAEGNEVTLVKRRDA